jgi:hypothetical protein
MAVYRQSDHFGMKPLEAHEERFFNGTLVVIVFMKHPL